MLLTAKQAASVAAKYLKDLIPSAEGVLLEEVDQEISRGKLTWNITLSFVPGSGSGVSILPYTISGKKDYKAFRIDATSGEVISMKIRNV